MKKIVLEKYEYTVETAEDKLIQKVISDKDILKSPMENVTINGREQVTVQKLRVFDKLCDLIDKADKDLLLEEGDYKELKKSFNEYGNWNKAKELRKIIIKVGDKLDTAEDVKVKEEK